MLPATAPARAGAEPDAQGAQRSAPQPGAGPPSATLPGVGAPGGAAGGAPPSRPGTPRCAWNPGNHKTCRPAHPTYPGVINLVRSFNLNVQGGPHPENSAAGATSCHT